MNEPCLYVIEREIANGVVEYWASGKWHETIASGHFFDSRDEADRIMGLQQWLSKSPIPPRIRKLVLEPLDAPANTEDEDAEWQSRLPIGPSREVNDRMNPSDRGENS